ncbi:MAG: YesL family protein [Oscillospiraceae bacterium]|nr:YesL family protein [Oscillospiraceae bacterium]
MKDSKTSRIGEVLSGLIDLIFAGLLWLICSLPIITIGASSTALYYAVAKCVRHNRGRLAPTFFHGFRSNFRQATVIWLLFLLWLLIGTADAYAFRQMGYGQGTLLHNISFLFFLPPLFFFPWVFSYLSRFENTVKGTLKFSAWLMLRHIGKSILLAAELALFLLICFLLPQVMPLLPAAVCLIMSLVIEPVFSTFQTDDNSSDADAWYNE